MSTNLPLKLRSGAWVGDGEWTVALPDRWQVTVYGPHDAPALTESEVAAALAQPIGTGRLSQLAVGKRSAAIVVDDLSRPTPAHAILPYVVEELKTGGLAEEVIRFVIGGGAHRPLTREEKAKKVGSDLAGRHEVHNHYFYGGRLQGCGELEDGTPIYLNEVVAQADLKICVGAILPHLLAGFGGGAKLIMPGVVGFATIDYTHRLCPRRARGSLERNGEERDLRDNAEEVARRIGLDAIVNLVLNSRREIAGLFVGDVVEAYRAGARWAPTVYGTPLPRTALEDTDILIINCYPQDYDPVQLGKSLWPVDLFAKALKVVLNPASDGNPYHGLKHRMDYARFVQQEAGRPPAENFPERPEIRSSDTLVLCSSNYPPDDFYASYPEGALFTDWDPLRAELRRHFPTARVAVLPYAPIQLPQIQEVPSA